MATEVFTNALFWVNATDLSDHVAEVTLNYSSESLDETAMGDTTRIRKGGLKDWSMDVNFQQDFAAAKVDATLFSLMGTTACLMLRPKNSCSTGINPDFSGIGVLETYPPLGGAVGTLLMARATWRSASTLTRASSS